MKKVIVLLISVASFFYGNKIYAQDLKSHSKDSYLSLHYGRLSNSHIISAIGGLSSLVVLTSTNVTQASGSFLLSYKKEVSKRILLGGSLGIEKIKMEQRFIPTDEIFKGEHLYFSMAGEMDFRYIHRENFQLYSGIGLGYTLSSSNNKDLFYIPNRFDFQLILIGMKYGKEIGFITEFGGGYKGIINFGVFVNLNLL